MGHTSQNELIEKLNIVKSIIHVGDIYFHYKNKELKYEIKDIVMIEEIEEVGVVYKAMYGEEISWMRSVQNFNEFIEIDGIKTKRFIKA